MITQIKSFFKKNTLIANITITFSILLLSTIFCLLLYSISPGNTSNISLILYMLSVFFIARYTHGYTPGIIASLISVICVNFLFTYPFFELNFTLTGYPVTFVGMFTIAIITSTMTTNMKQQAFALAEHEKMLHEAEKEKMRATLLRAVSHDLRTPLTGIIGASNSILDSEVNLSRKEELELIENISSDANWLLHMVENLLSVTRIQEDISSIHLTPEPIEEVIEEALHRLKKRYPDADIKVSLPDEFIMIPVDAMLIEQVIINLLENALLHSCSTKATECYLENHDSYITIYIKDYGIGLKPETIPTIFDGNVSKYNCPDGHKGMGIGLSICRTIVKAHGGNIYASNHEHGALFYFTLLKENSDEH